MPDLVIANARTVATMDDARTELAGGWVAITDGLVAAVGTGAPPAATTVIDATDCLVTPGLVNTHHHMFQNLTRAFPPMTDKPLFGWLQSLYPRWRGLDTEGAYLSAWVGLAELALSGCTTSTDHLYLHPRGAGDLLAAEIDAARDLGVRFHPTRGSMSLSQKDGGLPPDDVVADDDDILAASEDAVHRHHDRGHGAMTRIALAPCSPFTVTEALMVRSAELAERLDVRLHTHFAENAEDDEFSLATFGCRPTDYLERTGWLTDRAWLAHCVHAGRRARSCASATPASVSPTARRATSSCRRASRPSSPCAPPGWPSGSASTGRRRPTPRRCGWRPARRCCWRSCATARPPATARRALEMATLGGAACLGRTGELGVLAPGAVGDVAVWSLTGPSFAGAIADPVEAWLRCGPVAARGTRSCTVARSSATARSCTPTSRTACVRTMRSRRASRRWRDAVTVMAR